MPAVFDLQDCLRRARLGDTEAGGALVAHLHPLVARLVRRHLPRRELEEDLAQEVFIKILQRLDRYEERQGVPFEHWVSRLTVRTCLDALRAEKARPEWRVADLGEGGSEWVDFLLERQPTPPVERATDAAEVLERLLCRLSPPDRLVITLLDLEERSTAEISQMTGWTRPMVKMRAMRARRKLRGIAREIMKEEFDP
ncbi:MAG TPA: RNA polymerase sigma factor [Prosthecobacter sp.]|nr:RNA polymerase sigma factor [Prosthecobacter sp.]HRK14829.1 RNA polymerase sigma factor [Prosthecobacter sp.]